jgi:NAD(P)-dependent dehydrogenase (short-subunit alcohol dehydrogenase family)
LSGSIELRAKILFMAKSTKGLFDLTGRVAIITGGAGLLGMQYASAIAEAGGHVVIADLSQETVAKSAAEITNAYGVEAIGIQVDITQKILVTGMVDSVVKKFGQVDILINNAALTVKGGSEQAKDYFAPFEDYPVDLWEKALQVNLTGMFLCCQAVGKVMFNQRSGVILNIASDVGNISPDHRIYEGVVNPHSGESFNTPVAYATTKAGVINFTRYLATYWANKGIRVNSISPGGVYTDHDPEFVKNLTSRIPLNRMADVDEYKGAILFLVSDASSYMTGANLIIDGGRTAW